MKVICFLGMMAAMLLLFIFSFLFFMFRKEMDLAGILLITAGIILSVYVLIFSVLVAGRQKWNDRDPYSPDNFTPMV